MRLIVLVMVFPVFAVGCAALDTSRRASQAAGRDSSADLSSDTDVLDAKGSKVVDLASGAEVGGGNRASGVAGEDVEAENMTNVVIQGGGVRADWLFAGAIGVGVAIVLLWRRGSRFRDDLAGVILAVERCEGAGSAVKREIAVRSARGTGLGRMVRRVTVRG